MFKVSTSSSWFRNSSQNSHFLEILPTLLSSYGKKYLPLKTFRDQIIKKICKSTSHENWAGRKTSSWFPSKIEFEITSFVKIAPQVQTLQEIFCHKIQIEMAYQWKTFEGIYFNTGLSWCLGVGPGVLQEECKTSSWDKDKIINPSLKNRLFLKRRCKIFRFLQFLW